MKTPKHFRSYKGFSKYILHCAIRDRETLAQAWTPKFGEPDDMAKEIIAETNAEVAAMRERLKAIR